jgi:hypothetical protein
MLKINMNVKGLKEFEKYVDFVNKMANMKNDVTFQKFIQDKCMKTLNKVMDERISFSGGTVDAYKNNNKIEEFSDGFILYNHTVVDATSEGYGGIFSIALAFEYGTGIVGEEHPKANAWGYNLNKYEKGWSYFKNGSFHFTAGYEGFEVFRFTADEITKNLKNWVYEYYSKEV